MLKSGIDFKYKTLLLALILLIPLGLVMDFVHELGHVVWGTAVGGRLTYMKIAYFEIYPQLAITSQFILGYVIVEGLSGPNHGLFLLGGSLTTNIISWVLAFVLFKVKFGFKTRLGLKIMGLFGLADLPFYIIFPQIGLNHWIFLGGRQPEPLIGARMMGIQDLAFYILVFLSAFVLCVLYFRSFRERILKKVICVIR